jgi:glycosyltransferase involved in cell wall biosynthesis
MGGNMKVSVIIASFNRPKLLAQALASVQAQTHPDIELVLVDESDLFNVRDLLVGFTRPCSLVRQFVLPDDRKRVNRLGVNMNTGLAMAKGDLVCFLADDDYYFPTWIEKAVEFFVANPAKAVGYGRLFYTKSMVTTFQPPWTEVRFPKGPVFDPFGVLDHNQVIHRNFHGRYLWTHDVEKIGGSDAWYFRELASNCTFYAIDADAAVKRLHQKGLQNSQAEYQYGISGLRE